jgi:hypothetical protein
MDFIGDGGDGVTEVMEVTTNPKSAFRNPKSVDGSDDQSEIRLPKSAIK